MRRIRSSVIHVAVLLSISILFFAQHLRRHRLGGEPTRSPPGWKSAYDNDKLTDDLNNSTRPTAIFPSTYAASTYIDADLDTLPLQANQLVNVSATEIHFVASQDGTGESEEATIDIPIQTSATASSSVARLPEIGPFSATEHWIPAISTGKAKLFDIVPQYVDAIMSPVDTHFDRLNCPKPSTTRYQHLQIFASSASKKPKYFFALDLFQYVNGLPRLLGSVVEVIRFIGPQICVLSVLEGRSEDGTFEVLSALEVEMQKLGVQYILQTSDINPLDGRVNRIEALANLRNQALAPLFTRPKDFDIDSTVVFMNDVALCAEDILELLHQKVYQQADMTCAMDWINDGSDFYDVWISRQMNGDLFFEIAQNGGWEYSKNLLWNDPGGRERLNKGLPLQVFACWNGAAVFTARPLLQQKIRFRSNHEGECYLGEPVHFAKDLWRAGHGKIAVVPSVNIGYSDEQSTKVKDRHGTVSSWVAKYDLPEDFIDWDLFPPKRIKCVWDYNQPSWVLWNQ